MFLFKKPKSVMRSVTVWGALTGLYGALSTVLTNPLVTGPLLALFGIDPVVGMKINAIAAIAGPLIALYGRVRAGGGAPLVLTATETAAAEKALGPEKAAALAALAQSGLLGQLAEALKEILPTLQPPKTSPPAP